MRFNEYKKTSKSFLLNESITYDYRAPRNLQKQCMDFFILSLIWKSNSSGVTHYKKSSTNEDLKNILEQAIDEVVKYQKANLYRILISILALEIFQNKKDLEGEEEEFSNLSEIKNKWDTYGDKNYFRVIPEIMKSYEITPNKLLELSENHPEKSLQDIAGMVKILKSSEKLDDQIEKIGLIYNKVRNNQWIIDRFPRAKSEWKKFLDDIYNKGRWNVTRDSSIPLRIISYLAKYKGIDVNEKLINKSKEIKQLSEQTKKDSLELLKSYLNDRPDLIRIALESQMKKFTDEMIHNMNNEDFIDAFSYDAVYNNRRYKNPKLDLSMNCDFALSLDPYRYYDEKRKRIGVWLGEKSKLKNILEEKSSKPPKSFTIKLSDDFEDYKKHFLKNNKIQSLGSSKQQDLIEFEVLYP